MSQLLFNQAVQAFQRGNTSDADRLCAQMLKADANNLMAKNLMGVIRSQQGRHAEALPLIAAVLKANPNSLPTLVNYGLVQQAMGRFQDAMKTYDKALAVDPRFVGALFNRANTLRELKRYSEALTGYDKALAADPQNVGALFNGANVLQDMGRFNEALARFDRALALQPNFVPAITNRANAMCDLKRFDEALAGYDKALAIDPRYTNALYNRGATLVDLKRLTEALASFDRALAVQPDFVQALDSRGKVLQEFKRYDEALASYDKALAAGPPYAELLYNRGITFADMRRFDEALASYDKSIALRADHPEAHYNRGLALWGLEQFGAAVVSYDKAIALRPTYVAAWNNRGIALYRLHRIDEALASYNRALEINPDDADALSNRANLQWSENHLHEPAIRDLERLLTVAPDYDYARGDLLHLRLNAGDWSSYEREAPMLHEGVRAGRPVVKPFAYQALSESPADLRACSESFAARTFAAQPALWPQRKRGADSGSNSVPAKIRVGYVSGEFHEQATAYLMAGLYERHDKTAFEILAFDNGPKDKSPTRDRLEAAFDKMIDISGLTDRAAAERVLAEEVDILVNLNGYFGRPRMGIFTLKPAPIQVNYLGFPATLGAACIDYIVADRQVIPENERVHYCENVVYLPDSYQVNDDKRAIAADRPSRAACGLPAEGFVFCNFNQSYKLLPDTFALWMRILRGCEGSVLWMLENNSDFRDNLRRAAAEQGVSAERLVLAPHVPMPSHLARLQLADLFLDSRPYNAHTTASDALWAGVPLLTLRGRSFAGRVAASVLNAVGLPELVVESAAEFEAAALRLTGDPAALAALRRKLADNRTTQPLFDTDRFRRNLEAAYIRMMEIHRRGEAPHSFGVG